MTIIHNEECNALLHHTSEQSKERQGIVFNASAFFKRLQQLRMQADALCKDGKASTTVPVMADDLRQIHNILYRLFLEDQARESRRSAS